MLHLLSDGRKHALFDPNTMDAYALDGTTLRVLKETPGTNSIDPKDTPNAVHINELLSHLATRSKKESKNRGALHSDDNSAKDKTNGRRREQPEPLQRLVLHVSNMCNLRCAYCYADGGTYGRKKGHMPVMTAFFAINWVMQSFGGIENIQFFGGEPLLNPLLIIEVCEYFKALRDSKKIKEMPEFSMVTNGTLGDDSIIRLLKRYGIGATVSIDGPKEIHDRLRGKNSYEKTDGFMQTCLDRNLNMDVECTWTQTHADAGISIVDLIDFFYTNYGLKVTHIVPVSAAPGSPLFPDKEIMKKNYMEAARYSVKTFFEGDLRANSLSYRILESLRDKIPNRNFCPAENNTLAVAADGWLYPCFMLVGDNRFRICRFSEDGKIRGNRSKAVTKRINRYDKSRRDDCLSCWAAPLCTGCIGGDLIETGRLGRHPNCDLTRAIAETVILELADL